MSEVGSSYTALQDNSFSRSEEARKAFKAGDVNTSKQVHLTRPVHQETTSPEGQFVKPIIFGGLDGISTIFGFLAGAVGAKVSLSNIVVLGCAQLFAGAFGMGFGEYLSSEAERHVAQREMAREEWEVENFPEGEVSEMVQIYMNKGLSQEDAKTVANTLSKYKDFWVEHMMLTEIGMMPPDGDPWQAMLQGAVMFCSFLFLGALPLAAYAIAQINDLGLDEVASAKVAAAAATGALFLLGLLKAHIADMPLFRGGASMALQGLMSAGGAYVIGTMLPEWLDLVPSGQ